MDDIFYKLFEGIDYLYFRVTVQYMDKTQYELSMINYVGCIKIKEEKSIYKIKMMKNSMNRKIIKLIIKDNFF